MSEPTPLRPHLIGLLAFTLAAGVALAWHGPIVQDQAYHDFADHRSWLGIPNASDVLSNLAFALAAWAALPALRRATWADPRDRWPWLAFVASLLLTALGSAYYHWAPDDARLFWDRLPLSLTLAALAAATLGERGPAARGPLLTVALLPLGALATTWWRWSGDLRPYILAQFVPVIVVAWLALVVPGRYSHGRAPLVAALGYAVAKLCEHLDGEILSACGGLVSGHTLKHLAAAAGGWWLVRTLARRTPLNSGG